MELNDVFEIIKEEAISKTTAEINHV